MTCVKIAPNIYWNGLNDRTTDLFEGIWPISKEGVTYNSYIINDEKIALIDLVKGIKTDEFLIQIGEVVDPAKIDYIIINHMEQDHSGNLLTMIKIAPNVTFIGTEKTKEMIKDYYGLDSNFMTVKTGDSLKLGKHTLVFYEVPFVHWPETMVTYDQESGILFSCDAFGSYGAFTGSIFDDQYENRSFYHEEALRYYTNIVARFSKFVLKAIDAIEDLDIKIIAPSHGLVWRKNPNEIIDLYKKWADYSSKPSEKGITLLYASMYGNTEKMMNVVASGASKSGLPIQIFDVARKHVSYILPYLWKYRGVLLGTPTYETKLFPPMAYILELASYKRIMYKKVARFGSYGWSGGAQRDLETRIEKLKWEITDVFEFRGGPTTEDLKKGEEFGLRFAELIKGDND